MPRRPKPNPGDLCGVLADGTLTGRRARSHGGPCKNRAGQRTIHVGFGACWMHGGSTRAAQEKGLRLVQEHEAKIAASQFGLPIEVDPHTALLEELWSTKGHIAWLEAQIDALEDGQLHGPVGSAEFPRAEPHVWIRVLQDERKHYRAVAEACIRAGIEERRMQLQEDIAQAVYAAFRLSLVDLDTMLRKSLGVDDAVIDVNSPKVLDIVRKRLTEAASASPGG